MRTTNKRGAATCSLVRLDEAASRLAISRRTLQSLIAQKLIPVVRVSARRVAVHPDDIDAYIERQRQ